MTGLSLAEVYNVLKGIAPLVSYDLGIHTLVVHALADGSESLDLSLALLDVYRPLDAEVEGLSSLSQLADVVSDLLPVVVKYDTQGTIYINVEDRHVVLAGALIKDAVTQPLDILEQLLALETYLLLYVIEESVGQDISLLDDHLVDVVVAIVTRLCEDWDPLVRQGGVILVSDDLSHQLALCLSDSIEACLCHAVADGGVILLTIGVCVLVDQISHLAEVGDLLTLIERSDLLHDHRDEVLCEEERITASGS